MPTPPRRHLFILGNVGVFVLAPSALFLAAQFLPGYPKDKAIYGALFGYGTLFLAWIVLGIAMRVNRLPSELAGAAGFVVALIYVAICHQVMSRVALFFLERGMP